MIQIVGHTVLAQIRYTTSMAAIGVDTGMVYGRRNFLELTPDGRFVAHHGNSRSSWTATDLSDEYCSKLAAVHA